MKPENTVTPATTRLQRNLLAYATETKFECLRVLRSPGFTIPMLFLPIGFYLLLGVGMSGMRGEPDSGRAVLIFVSFLVYGIVAPGLLGVSSLLAGDRVQKIVEYKRALPAPYGSQVVAKLLMAIALSIADIVLLIGLGATLGGVPLNAGQFGAIGTIVLAGVFPVWAIGSYLATRAAPSGVSPIAGALLVGMAILGGLFYPLPGVLSTLRPLWPTYHLQQLCLAALGQATAYSPATHVVALIAITGLFGLLAASRLARAE